MKVSVIIPVYNAEQYIREAVKSVLEQTYTDIEVIAVNDGSTDKSLEILREYENKIKVISKPNGGTASALNTGIKMMTGEWFKWLGADDILYPTAVEELVSIAAKIQDKNTIIYSDYDIIDGTGLVIRQFIEPNYNNTNQFERNTILLDHFFANAGTILIHKSIFDRFGLYDETIGFQEDYELWLRLCLQHDCKLYLVSKILMGYRVHQNQLTVRNQNKNLANAKKIRQLVLQRLEPQLQEKYQKSLKKYQKTKPLSVKSRHVVRDIIFKVLPRSVSSKILNSYMRRKER
ncbi:Glycosyl transferase [Nitrosotalea sinensis]|uniref:Glycosyl transferase n=1 Tax=Nitrosotalea sinensis TaxID=1499975 RepID=A0A2H1EEV8_9ARCH|nr:glycosyltransferase family 2 protein [Candidatus Nitrosotalea sinensis]SHO42680.1 Glycosyl transferase [Candidatus Nitrosotalea sinensis]